jgi:hypothetical protein
LFKGAVAGVLASVGIGGAVSGGGHSSIGHGLSEGMVCSWSVGVGVGVGVSVSSHFSEVSSGSTGSLAEVGQVGKGVGLGVGFGFDVGRALGVALRDRVGRGGGTAGLLAVGGGCALLGGGLDGGREVADPSAGGVVSV